MPSFRLTDINATTLLHPVAPSAVQRGLFERHKLLFALMLTNKILVNSGKIRASDLDVFLKGGGALDINSVRKKPKEWIPDSVWLNIVALSNMDAFRDIPDSVFRNDGLWRQWYDQEAPEMAKVGGACCFGGGGKGYVWGVRVLRWEPRNELLECMGRGFGEYTWLTSIRSYVLQWPHKAWP